MGDRRGVGLEVAAGSALAHCGQRGEGGTGMLLSEVEESHQELWFWWGYIPLGAVTLLEGEPGAGKSLVALDLIARATRGGVTPDGSDCVPRGGAVLINREDHVQQVVVPRLRAAGADLARVIVLDSGEHTDSKGHHVKTKFNLARHLSSLYPNVGRAGASLIVIDHLEDFVTPGKAAAAISALNRFAQACQCAAVVVRHAAKGTGRSVLHRGAGSMGIIGAARAALLVAPSPTPADPHRRLLIPTKNNLAPLSPAVAFHPHIPPSAGAGPRGVALEWLGTRPATDPQVQRAASGDPAASLPLDEAIVFLRGALRDGPRPALEVEAEARAEALSLRTLRRARKELGVVAAREGFGPGGRWMWALPSPATADDDDATGADSAEDAPDTSPSTAGYEDSSGYDATNRER